MFQFFTYIHMDILHTCILYKVFHNCSVPDVASGVIALLHIISVVAAFLCCW